MKVALLSIYIASLLFKNVHQNAIRIQDLIANCSSPLGMESGKISDRALIASSKFGENFGPQRARLHLDQPPRGYRADAASVDLNGTRPWITVDLGEETVITGISTQGYGDITLNEWVTKYNLWFSSESSFLPFKETSGAIENFTGNSDINEVKHHDVSLPVITSTVMVKPLEWNNNVGLRMELYGCAPGYYFLARFIVAEQSFTLAFLDKESEYYKTWAADTLDKIKLILRYVPGFLKVKFRRFRLSTDLDALLRLNAEVEIHCIKEAADLITATLNTSDVGSKDSMFASKIDFVYPAVNSSCAFPEVDIHFNQTITAGTEVLTTSNVRLRADITLCNSRIKTIPLAKWEIFIIMGKSSLTLPLVTIPVRDLKEYEFNPRFCEDCYPAYLYVRFTAHLKEIDNKTLDVFGFLKIVQPALVANIRGPKKAKKQFGAGVVLNASNSYDPDILSKGTLNFTWLCRRTKDEAVYKGECQYGRKSANGTLFYVHVNKLKSKHTYEFNLTVSKGNRKSFVTHQLKILPALNFSFSCTPTCRNKISRSKPLNVIPKCEGQLCKNVTMTTWSIRANETTSNGKQWKRIADKNVFGLGSPQRSFVAKQLALHSTTKIRDPVYKIKATIEIRARNDVIKEEHDTIVQLNSLPIMREDINNGCFVEPKEGYAVETTFNITCVGWQDEDKPLTYEFHYNTSACLVVNDPTMANTLSTNLPVGLNNSELPVDIYIKDSLGDNNIYRVKVKVKKKNSSGDGNKTMYRIANDEPNKLKYFIENGEHAKACDLAISVFSDLEARKQSSQRDDEKDNLGRRVQINIIKEIRRVQIKSKELLSKVSTVIAMATKDEIPLDSQDLALQKLVKGVDYLSKLMSNNSEDAATLIKQFSKNMLLGLGNILKMSSDGASSKHPEKDKKKSKGIAKGTLNEIWKFRNLITIERDDTPMVLTSGFLSMVVNRPSQTNFNRTVVDNTDFILPTYGNLFSEIEVDRKDITSKVVLFKSNPYTWHESASAVESWVIDVVLQKEGRTLNVSGLKDPVQLYIPQNTGRATPLSAKANVDQYFVKPSFDVNDSTLIQYHEINLTHDRAVVFVKLKPEISTDTPLRVYVSFSDFPTPTNHDFSTIIPDCEKLGDTEVQVDCVNDPKSYVFSFTAFDTGHVGIHYIGIHYYVKTADDVIGKEERMHSSNDSAIKKRIRKSCGDGSGRQKRSCVGVKDPPASPTPAPIVLLPTYNASTDLKYNLSVNIGSCLYWSEDVEKWTDEGCNVTSDVVSDSIRCLCNHLSAFGGDFFVAPNTIDFKKVFKEFPDLAETKNFVVLTTVCIILLLYTIGLIFTRRADKRDKQKTIPNVCLLDGEEYGVCHYHISIATGMWMGSGTTANVGLIIYGEDLCSGKIILNDSNAKKTFFARASVNTFTVSLPRSLGPIYKIKVWHDNTGNSPGWFLLDVNITDLESEQQWYFIANRWLAVEKASGEIELTINASNKQEISKFKNLFCSRASKRLADGHLWISVLTRPPQSLFTRTQRLSCCISVFFFAMITNAMFYDKEEDAKDTFQIGPLAMSWTQVKIGIQSAMIAFPVNVIIVAIFRNVKPKIQQNKSSELVEENSPKGLPHCFIYIAWVLCVLAILSSSFFIVLYSKSWGRKKSNEWLTSILVSCFQDIVILQPIQVVLIACLLSVLVRKPIKHDPVYGLPRQKNPSENDSKVEPPEESELKRSRTFWVKLRKMFRSFVEIILFIIFVLLLFVVCYGNRDASRYDLTRSLKEIFPEFDNRVNSTPTFWNWTRKMLVPGVFFSEWYNKEKVELPEGFISSGYPFLVGMPRLRQIRVKTDACPIEDPIEVHVKRCLPFYSSISEDRTPFSLRDWTPITNISAFKASFKLDDLCPKPWRYQTAEALETLTFQGFYASYDGGGYIADLGYKAETALGVIDDLESNDWIDDRAFAVFIEFTVYEPSSTLFSAAKYLYERYPTGGTKTSVTIDTLMIYYPVDPSFRSFYLICQLILVLFTFGLFFGELIKLYCQGCKYFTHFWNFVDILQITVAVVAMTQYFFKAKYTSDFVRRVRKNPFETSSSDYIVRWCHLEIWLLSFAVFLVTIKMLRLIKFNHHICHLTHTVKSAVRHLASYSLVFTGTLLAYTQLGTLLFGSNAAPYSNMARSLRMLLERLLGNNMYTQELKAENDVTGQLFTFAYSVSIAMILINMFLTILNASYIEVRLLKQGRYPDVELAQFAWRYFLRKVQTYWRSFKGVKEPKLRLKRKKAKYFSVRYANVLHDSDRYFCTKYDENRSASYRLSEKGSTEECTCLSPEQFQYVDEFDDIDMVHEFSSLKDIKKTLLQIGTSFFLNKNQWSSSSLNEDDDDRGEAGSLKSEWSQGSESDQSVLGVIIANDFEDDRDIDKLTI